MSEQSSHDVTALPNAWRSGDTSAHDRLFGLVYRELRRQARRYLAGERRGHTLDPTALVHEAYLRLITIDRVDWQSRAHFFAMAARVMRRILVDSARARRYQKRGGGAEHVLLDDAVLGPGGSGRDLTALDDALTALAAVAAVDERKSRIVELKFFGGLTLDEAAEVLGVSRDTVQRDWRMAKVWLLRELDRASASPRHRAAIDQR